MRSSVSMQHTSDEELLCASLMRNSREIKAFFNSKLMYLVRDAQVGGYSFFGTKLDEAFTVPCPNRNKKRPTKTGSLFLFGRN